MKNKIKYNLMIIALSINSLALADMGLHGHSEAELKKAFISADINKDGFLDSNELSLTNKAQFDMVDLNKDNKVSKEEFVGSMIAAAQANGAVDMNLLKFAIVPLENMFNQKDANKDSWLSLEEYNKELVSGYARLDKNKDGRISIDEWKSQLNVEVSQESFSPLIAQKELLLIERKGD